MTNNHQILSISGIDGSGKTSIINLLSAFLEDNSEGSKYVWLRYNHLLTKLLLGFCRIIGLTSYEYYDGFRVGYHTFYKSRIVSWLFLILTYIDTFLVNIFLVYLPTLFGDSRVLICDRWVLDIMIDIEIDTRISFPSGGMLERMFLMLVPKRAGCYLVVRSREAVLEARPENTLDKNFPKRWLLYQEYSTRSWVTVVTNKSTISSAVSFLVEDAGLTK